MPYNDGFGLFLLCLVFTVLCLLQLPGDYSSLRETARYKIQCGKRLSGLCFHNHRLFSIESDGSACDLCMYKVTGQGLTLLDTITACSSQKPASSKSFGQQIVRIFWPNPCPRVDGYTQQVYVPNRPFEGLSVVSWEDNRLRTQTILTCVAKCHSVGVLSPNTLCACDRSSGSVSVIRVTDDTVTDTLKKPAKVAGKMPYNIADTKPFATAVLGSSILVWYGDRNLVVYKNGVSSLGTVVAWPEGLEAVSEISSDAVSRFLVCDHVRKAVFILNENGRLCDKININTDSNVYDCTVGDGKLWVGCANGDIVVMSPQ